VAAQERILPVNDTRADSLSQPTEKPASAEQELDALSYSIAHDLRAPLRIMDGFVRILEEDFGPRMEPDAQRYLSLVRGSAQRMNLMIDGVLEYSRLNRQTLKLQAVDPAALVDASYAELQPDRDGRSIELAVGPLPGCRGDVQLLRRVFRELLANAIKFTRPKPVARIEVGSRDVNGQQAYFMRDNGVGFDMRYAGKLFSLFQRLHSAEEYAGVGMGLAVVGRIVRRHGGRVWAEATVDQGAEFLFTVSMSAPKNLPTTAAGEESRGR
jgi:light-regulated signal transduction histidine kinase (bacteriophytochrome)